jgi:hypothetical protein
MTKRLEEAFARAAKLSARERDAFAEFVLAEPELRAQYAEAAKDSTREGEARAWVGGIQNPARRAGWEARFLRAGAGRVRESLWGDVPPDEPLDR